MEREISMEGTDKLRAHLHVTYDFALLCTCVGLPWHMPAQSLFT